MDRRRFTQFGLAAGALARASPAWAQDTWGADRGYPTGWGGKFNVDPAYRVGNYSGGYERMFPHRVIEPSKMPSALAVSPVKDFTYRWGFFRKTPQEYLDIWSTTGLLICRNATIVHESYRRGRTQDMRLTSWSMAKSVTSLLLGICLDRKLIDSYDDTADKYLPELEGTLHGAVTLRNLSNMSSGAEILHQRDNRTIYPSAFTSKDSNIARTVSSWNQRKEEQGRTYNYNELCPLTIGMVLRKVTQGSLSEFAQQNMWQPMGAQANATWTTDSTRCEFNCVGLAATLRDWARLGVLIANRGRAGARQVVSESWIDECTSWSARDRQVRVGVPAAGFGYKAHMWHRKPDGSLLYFNGHHGQRVIVDLHSKTVLVHTAVDHEGHWQAELFEMFDAATRLS